MMENRLNNLSIAQSVEQILDILQKHVHYVVATLRMCS